MKNPWLKKNPMLSLWLSGANAVAGAARGRATSEARRQTALASTAFTNAAIDAWTAALTPPKPRKKRKASRRAKR
ncbi:MULTISPECIES: hypothetical protein [Cupriavidus]|mgnify:CR=1 FL=1|uniref:ESPR domain-containing protein n=1 Tax=Cupriavidus pauculus TaxID=82633 RepID=A0A3G8H5Z0_9BURK|nr:MULTISPECIES: hypothetical protein [Cupriavidus]AZG15874.1 hypothetical protein EHF44_20775 [Cupriavidus pauculus]MDT6963650.1 hypothetical protein [Cupriavidus sp. SZY C1]